MKNLKIHKTDWKQLFPQGLDSSTNLLLDEIKNCVNEAQYTLSFVNKSNENIPKKN